MRRYSGYGHGFDAAVMAPAADVVALVMSTGTKALLLEPGGKVIRELNRSYYCAEAYRYPLVLFTLPDGRTGLVHCPEHYNQLKVEVARTGERLTGDEDRDPDDFFHSRLAVSPEGRFLLSTGWVWHPFGIAEIYDLSRALEQPSVLDALRTAPWSEAAGVAEISGACFAGQDVVIGTSADEPDTDEPGRLGPRMLARWSAARQQFTWIRQLAQTAGDLMPIGNNILALYQCPRLYARGPGKCKPNGPAWTQGRQTARSSGTRRFPGRPG